MTIEFTEEQFSEMAKVAKLLDVICRGKTTKGNQRSVYSSNV